MWGLICVHYKQVFHDFQIQGWGWGRVFGGLKSTVSTLKVQSFAKGSPESYLMHVTTVHVTGGLYTNVENSTL